jgi:hypothetical protein
MAKKDFIRIQFPVGEEPAVLTSVSEQCSDVKCPRLVRLVPYVACCLLWQVAHSVIKFCSESLPIWLRNVR